MNNILKTILLFLLLTAYAAAQNIHHGLNVVLEPLQHHLSATDTLLIPADQVTQPLTFLLTSDLKVKSLSPGVHVRLLKAGIAAEDQGMDKEQFDAKSAIGQNKYALDFDQSVSGDLQFVLTFSGNINHPITQSGQEYARGFSQTPGLIEKRGAYLSGSTFWVPWFNENLITYSLTTSVPDGWDVVSQGKRDIHRLQDAQRISRWQVASPTEEVFLIAAAFHEYRTKAGAVDVLAFLRTPDESLANKYLETTAQYLDMYRKLIGPYPYSKFALVENFWPTGYGMPSFTLLGDQIIRFPFILHSSYPHELLHNWWGNSVYVNFDQGNWCEGLTAYMADHLVKEQRGQGAEYRRSTLQNFTDYVNPENDFPLNKFISRNSAATAAVGYGKSLMTWNMLRDKVGDANFIKGVQTFYRNEKFKRASFDDIRRAFEQVSGQNLKAFFDQWVTRTGAPKLALKDVRASEVADEFHLDFTVEQTQTQKAFTLDIPLAVSFSKSLQMDTLHLDKKSQTYNLRFKQRPLEIRLDPQFSIFRKLDNNEISPSLSKVFGADKILIVLPKNASGEQFTRYQTLAKTWTKGQEDKISIKSDDSLDKLPADRAVWIFGASNKFHQVIEKGIADYDAVLNPGGVRFGKTTLKTDDNSFIIAVRNPANPIQTVVYLTIGNPDAAAGLARKLPHYGKYSYLAFEGSEPTNIAKGQWAAVHSPLVALLPVNGSSAPMIDTSVPLRPALAQLAPVFSAKRMMQTVSYLAGPQLKGRAPGSDGIEKAAAYIVDKFREAGLQPGADDGSYFQQWQAVVDAQGNKAPVKNIIAIIPGSDPKLKGQSVVVSAHYDHLGLGWPDVHKGDAGKVHPGADDNASGVAVMLELAKILGKTLKPQRTIVFVAFTLEEEGLLGSQYFIKHSKRYPASKIIGDLNLDTVGRLGANKLLVLNSSSAREWPFIFMGAGYVTGVTTEMVTQDLDGSDQVSFIRAGIPAVQFFSGVNSDYHRPSDTADKIDAAGMVKVASFVREGIVYLAERPEALTNTINKTSGQKKPLARSARSVSTGSVPDFAFSGKGVRLSDVHPGSAAAKAGWQKNDIIIAFDGKKIANMRDYSNALKAHKPGDSVHAALLRGGKKLTTTIILMER